MNLKIAIPRMISAFNLIVILSIPAFCIVQPTIISIEQIGRYEAKITWRDNDLNTARYRVYRKKDGEDFERIKTIFDASTTTFNDSKLIDGEEYHYAVSAQTSSDSSVLSDTVSITIEKLPVSIGPPHIIERWWDSDSSAVRVISLSTSVHEDGYGFRLQYEDSTITQAVRGGIEKYDNTPDTIDLTVYNVNPNTWYRVQTFTWHETDTAWSDLSESFYTVGQQQCSMPEITVGDKISEYPIDLKGWVVKAGDSLYVTERNTEYTQYSIISIENRETPLFVEYKDLTDYRLLKFSDTIRSPFYQNTPQDNRYLPLEDSLLVCTDTSLIKYSVKSGTITPVDSIMLRDRLKDEGYRIKGILPVFDQDRFVLFLQRAPLWGYFMNFGDIASLTLDTTVTRFSNGLPYISNPHSPGLIMASFIDNKLMQVFSEYLSSYDYHEEEHYRFVDFTQGTEAPVIYERTKPEYNDLEGNYSIRTYNRERGNLLEIPGINKNVYGGYVFTGTTVPYFLYAIIDNEKNQVIFVHNNSFSIYSIEEGGPLQDQTITFSPPQNTTYGDAPVTLTASANSELPVGFTSSDSTIASVTEDVLTINGAGTVSITAFQNGDDEYAAAPQVTCTLTIARKALTISGLSAQDKTYDGTADAHISGTATLDGLLSDDDVQLTDTISGTFEDKNTGENKSVTITGILLSGEDTCNYQAAVAQDLTADITPRDLTITADDITKNTGDPDPDLSVTYEGFAPGEDSTVLSGLTVTREPGEEAGTYAITPSGASASNYIIQYVSGVLSVVPTTSVLSEYKNKKVIRNGLIITQNPVSLSEKATFEIHAQQRSKLKIRIYSSMGDLMFVKTVDTDRTGYSKPIIWDLTNTKGQKVATGTYLIRVDVYEMRSCRNYRFVRRLGIRN